MPIIFNLYRKSPRLTIEEIIGIFAFILIIFTTMNGSLAILGSLASVGIVQLIHTRFYKTKERGKR